MDVVELF